MYLLFKQKFFSWFDSYNIFDESGNIVFEVQGKLDWGHRLHIHDAAGRHIGTVKERVLTFLPKFELYIEDRYVGEIRKEFTFFRPKYLLDCQGQDWQIAGDFLGWNYQVTDSSGQLIMSADKELFNWTDTYSISIINPNHALYSLMIVLAIDAANCSNSK